MEELAEELVEELAVIELLILLDLTDETVEDERLETGEDERLDIEEALLTLTDDCPKELVALEELTARLDKLLEELLTDEAPGALLKLDEPGPVGELATGGLLSADDPPPQATKSWASAAITKHLTLFICLLWIRTGPH